MAEKKKAKEKEYIYVVITKCEKCGLEPEVIGPCSKCKSEIFTRTYLVVEK